MEVKTTETEISHLFFDEIQECVKCSISRLRINTESGKGKVVGAGNLDANVFIIGIAPGFFRDRDMKYGTPFNLFALELYENDLKQGNEAGKQTRRIIETFIKYAKLDKEDCYVTNILKCSTESDRVPSKKEISNCMKTFLLKEVYRIKPKLVIIFGAVIRDLFKIRKFNLPEEHGGVICFATYHPSYYVRSSDKERFKYSTNELSRLINNMKGDKKWKERS